jgi:hypothetical protein
LEEKEEKYLTRICNRYQVYYEGEKLIMNDFEKLCQTLETSRKGGNDENEYESAYKEVKKYIGTNKNKLYKLKGEAHTGDYIAITSVLFTIYADLLAFFSLLFIFCTNIINDQSSVSIYEIFLLILIVGSWIYLYRIIKKNTPVEKWRGYIQVAIDNLEKEGAILTACDNLEK